MDRGVGSRRPRPAVGGCGHDLLLLADDEGGWWRPSRARFRSGSLEVLPSATSSRRQRGGEETVDLGAGVCQRFKAVVADCAARSRTLLLLQSDEMDAELRDLHHDLAMLLDLLPVVELALADDVMDLLALASRQCRRCSSAAADAEPALKTTVLTLIADLTGLPLFFSLPLILLFLTAPHLLSLPFRQGGGGTHGLDRLIDDYAIQRQGRNKSSPHSGVCEDVEDSPNSWRRRSTQLGSG